MTAVVESTRNHHIRFCDGPSLSLNKNLSEFSSLNGKDDTGDVWSCYYIPLTPPYSPVTLIDPTKETEEDFGCDRLQPVCLPPDDILGETLDNIKTYRDVNSVVIKDCMWGAQDVPARTQQRKRESKLGEHPTGQRIVTETFDSSKIVSVDPTEVFPSSLAAEGSLDLKDFSSCSDSDDDSDIDVVTVEAQDRGCGENENIMDIEQDSVVLASPPKTPDMVTPTEEKKIPTQSFLVLNLEALKPKEGAKAADAPPAKRTRLERDSAVTLTHGDKYSRASHNVLERKRRNELKSKFYRLRDSIPEMSDNKKVPKVAILKQAICYVHSLQREEAVLLAETDKQKQLATQLKNRIVSILRAGNVRK